MNINIKTFFILISLGFISLTLILIFSFVELNRLSGELREVEYNRHLMMQKADELRQSSDDLSRLANKYVISTNESYKDDYFMILSIRNGHKPRPLNYNGIYWDLLEPLRSLRHPLSDKQSLKQEMKNLPFSSYEVSKLQNSEHNSNDLVELELKAFKAMKNNEQSIAIGLLNSKEYDKAKEKIMYPIDEFLVSLEQRTNKIIEVYTQDIETLFQQIYALFIIGFLLFLGVIILVMKKILRPIENLTQTILSFQKGEEGIKEQLFYNDEVGLMTQQFFAMKKKMDDDYMHIKELSLTDPLTKIGNRRMFFELSEELCKISKRDKESVSLLMLDIDHFKKVNDVYGHMVGDEVLKFLVKELKHNLRESDIVARYGGEEFIVLMPRTEIEGACILAEKIRKFFEDNNYINKQGLCIEVRVSIGITQSTSEDRKIQEVILRADEALYKAKETGRNRVEVN